jgi:hypothetical protein
MRVLVTHANLAAMTGSEGYGLVADGAMLVEGDGLFGWALRPRSRPS